MNPTKKTIFTLNIGNYAPAITQLTYPLIKHYADKIGADFVIIDGEEFPGWPVTYQKLAINRLGREMQNDWNIYIDSDALVHPDFFDITVHIEKDTVAHNGKDPAMIRWSYDDEYFLRDGRFLGSCDWFAVASDWCLDLWHPLEDLTLEQALKRIHPTHGENNSGLIAPEHLIDDYVLSRNIARYGLKFTTVTDICAKFQMPPAYLFHLYSIPEEEKLKRMKKCLDNLQKFGVFMDLTPPPEPTGRLNEILAVVNRMAEKYAPLRYQPPNPEILGWMSRDELEWLYEQAQKHSDIVEIGCWKGRSTHALLSGCKGNVWAVDTFKGTPSELDGDHAFAKTGDVRAEFMKNVGHLPRLGVIQADSVEAADKFTMATLDMIFIDGDHTVAGVLRDLEAWCLKLRPGGLFCGHDAYRDDVAVALKQFFGKSPKIIPGTTIWVAE